jgi:hypothetical protein
VARPRRRWLRLALVVLPILVAAVLLGGGAALTCRPSWYQPTSIDYARLQDDKRCQLRLENEISAALNNNKPVEIELEEAQVNRWIAARDELWPGETPSLEPFSRPQVVFLEPNRVRLAALVEHSGMPVVLSATFRIDPQPDGLVLSWERTRAGVLPAPGKLIEQAARRLTQRLRLGQQAATAGQVKLPGEWTWPNGQRRFRLADLAINDGVLRVTLVPQ